MGQHILPGNPPVELNLRRSARARRISLRVSALDGRVTLTMPQGLAESEALNFAREKAEWLRSHLGDRPEEVQVAPGATVPFEGRFLRIAIGYGRTPMIEGDHLWVPGSPETVPARLRAWLKVQARNRLAAASDRYSAALGQKYTRLTLRDTRSRWGSCSAKGGLMYSWRLILAPNDVLDYVAAHEVAHLVQMNHSRAFWSTVEKLKPGYEIPRRWLRENGSDLHRYKFGD